MQNETGFEIRPEQRQSWLSIAAVWAGGMICVPCLMIGGVLSQGGLSLAEIVISILIGYGLICLYMIFVGMQACDTGLPVAVMAEGALGKQGARYIISVLLAIACVGWFGIQSATCGQAFASMAATMLNLGTPSAAMVAISSIVWGAIMLLTACAGFKGLKWLNYVAVPLLVIVCLYGLIAGIVAHDGGEAIAAYAPAQSAGLVYGISMVVASFALWMVPKDSMKAAITSFMEVEPSVFTVPDSSAAGVSVFSAVSLVAGSPEAGAWLSLSALLLQAAMEATMARAIIRAMIFFIFKFSPFPCRLILMEICILILLAGGQFECTKEM